MARAALPVAAVTPKRRRGGEWSGGVHRDSALNVGLDLMVVAPFEHPVQDVLDLAKVVRGASFMLLCGPSLRMRSLVS
jgi:hypothetical protein